MSQDSVSLVHIGDDVEVIRRLRTITQLQSDRERGARRGGYKDLTIQEHCASRLGSGVMEMMRKST